MGFQAVFLLHYLLLFIDKQKGSLKPNFPKNSVGCAVRTKFAIIFNILVRGTHPTFI